MAPETQEQQNGSTSETEGQETQGQQQATTDETSGTGEQQQTSTVVIDDSTKLPETHPLVKTLTTLKANAKSAATELAEANARAAKATKLEEELAARPTPEALETLQTRYDRLEAFAQAVGLGKALDSRTFTKDLFESEKDVAELVKEFNRANPTVTSTALGGTTTTTAEGKQDPNKLIRAAWNGGK